jgi:hypothetical protein
MTIHGSGSTEPRAAQVLHALYEPGFRHGAANG